MCTRQCRLLTFAPAYSMTATAIPLPDEIYQDALEAYLLLQLFQQLYSDESGGNLPTVLGMNAQKRCALDGTAGAVGRITVYSSDVC